MSLNKPLEMGAFPLSLVEVGQAVIDKEKEALNALSTELQNLSPEGLGTAFAKAVNLINRTLSGNSPGRLIVSGMGKSGHIGKKMAATFASTGQPSFFVHPAESGHGDLGMITKHDLLLLISFSGETQEILYIIKFAKKNNIPMVAITVNPLSTLAKNANIVLVLPNCGEACPMGLAPTNSSTMTLALGDALAITLLTLREFKDEDFHRFHPSGSLGLQLRTLEEIMHTGKNLPLMPEEALMGEVIIEMTQKGFGCVGLIDNEGLLKGIITDGDLRRHMHEGLLKDKALNVMTQNPKVLKKEHLVAEALALFESKSIPCAFVVENDRPLGLVRLLDCIRSA
jgi:arabinose-5-phosphate isomerase